MLEDITYEGRHLIVKSYTNFNHKLIVGERVNGILEVYTFAKFLDASTHNTSELVNQLYSLLIDELLVGVANRSYVLVVSDETVIDCSRFKPSNIRWLGKGDPKMKLPLCYDAKDARWAAKAVIRVDIPTDISVGISSGLHAKICVIVGKRVDVSHMIEYLRMAESRTDNKITAMYVCTAKPPIDELAQVLAHLSDVKYLIYRSGTTKCRFIESGEEIELSSISDVMDLLI